MCATWRHLSTKICAEGGRLIRFSFIFKWRTGKKRARYRQRNSLDCIQNYGCPFHFIRNIRQTVVMSTLKLKIIRHNHENDDFITVINNRRKLQTNRNYRSERLQTKIVGMKINTYNQV